MQSSLAVLWGPAGPPAGPQRRPAPERGGSASGCACAPDHVSGLALPCRMTTCTPPTCTRLHRCGALCVGHSLKLGCNLTVRRPNPLLLGVLDV